MAAAAALAALAVAPAATAAPAPAALPAPVPAAAVPVAIPAVALDGPWAPAASAPLHPGVVTETAGGGSCTSNFVFTSGPRTFLGQAAHCAGTGESTETDGCTSATGPLGTPVVVRAADGTARRGVLAYSSWVTMQAIGESDPATCAYNDFALVELDPADVSDVNPSVPFFGGPTGVDTDGLRAGEQVLTFGNSPLRMEVAALGPKTGLSAGDAGGGWSHEVYTASPGVPGDSGSAFLDADGEAVGVLSTLNLAPLPVSNGVSDLARALEYAGRHGGLGEVALQLGTEPFSAVPVAVPAGLPVAG